MAGIVPVFVFLNEASIYTFLDQAFNFVDLVLWSEVPTLSPQKPFKLWSEVEVRPDRLFARQGWGQSSKNRLVALDELTETRVKVHALQLLRKSSSA